MTLDKMMRGILEKIIDTTVESIPDVVRSLHIPSEKARLKIEKESDFALGIALGVIYSRFSVTFFFTYSRYSNEEEQSEIRDVIYRRTADIREAIFKAG